MIASTLSSRVSDSEMGLDSSEVDGRFWRQVDVLPADPASEAMSLTVSVSGPWHSHSNLPLPVPGQALSIDLE
jgi:hypothetical protein